MIGGYGHDDRVCAYPAAMALFDTEAPEYTSVVILADKEGDRQRRQHGYAVVVLQIFCR